jgi:hypothetical protein
MKKQSYPGRKPADKFAGRVEIARTRGSGSGGGARVHERRRIDCGCQGEVSRRRIEPRVSALDPLRSDWGR